MSPEVPTTAAPAVTTVRTLNFNLELNERNTQILIGAGAGVALIIISIIVYCCFFKDDTPQVIYRPGRQQVVEVPVEVPVPQFIEPPPQPQPSIIIVHNQDDEDPYDY